METLCIDIDGVVADSVNLMWKYFKDYFDVEPDMSKRTMEDAFNVTSDEINRVWKFYAKQIYGECSVVPGALRALQDLYQIFDIVLVTARFEKDKKITKKWLKREHIPYDSLYLVGREKHKSDLSLVKKCKYFIEDDILNAMDLAKNGVNVFLFRSNIEFQNIICVRNWNEIVKTILVKEKLDEPISSFENGVVNYTKM